MYICRKSSTLPPNAKITSEKLLDKGSVATTILPVKDFFASDPIPPAIAAKLKSAVADTADVENANFRILATCTTTKYTASGLQRGKFYSFRIRCVGAKSAYGVVSEVTTCMAG